MFTKRTIPHFLLCALWLQGAVSVTAQSAGMPASGQKTVQRSAVSGRVRYRPDRFAGRAGTYYRLVWGVDGLSVKAAEAGEVIRFTYQVMDAEKAKTLNDKKLQPSLIDERAHVRLVVPTVDKVGQLRQSSNPEAGRTYWMLFSNKGGLVKRGDRVSVEIGKFRADGLIVD